MMDSLRTGCDIIRVETDTIIICIKKRKDGTSKNNIVNTDTKKEQSYLKVFGYKRHIFSIKINGKERFLENNVLYKTEPLFFEQTDYVLTVVPVNGSKVNSISFYSDSPLVNNQVGYFSSDDNTRLYGIINFLNECGFCDLNFEIDGKPLCITIEVYPSKIEYKEEYEKMLGEIHEITAKAVLNFFSKTYRYGNSDSSSNSTLSEFNLILNQVFDGYKNSVNRIIKTPHHKIITEYNVISAHKARNVDRKGEKWLLSHPDFIKKVNDSLYAERVLSSKKHITYDTIENQFVKFIIQSTIKRLELFCKQYSVTKYNDEGKKIVINSETIKRADFMISELKSLVRFSFLNDVSKFNGNASLSLVFGMAPGYRELFRDYILLQRGLSWQGDVFKLSVKDTAVLYEYWCFIKLYNILKDKYGLDNEGLIKVEENGINISLTKGIESKVNFKTKSGEDISLFYNRIYDNTETVRQKPDNVLELSKNGSKVKYSYVFDAKYRIKDGCPPEDTISAMHRYRDSILYENNELDPDFKYKKAMFGAYVLFPFSGSENDYEKSRFFKSIEEVNIGALPFLPGKTSLVEELLEKLVEDSPETVFEGTSLPINTIGKYREPSWEKDVLLGFVKDDNQIGYCHENNRYYTYCSNIRSDMIFKIKYIALCQRGNGTYCVGKIQKWDVVKRKDIDEFGGYPEKECYLFHVECWVNLDCIVENGSPSPIAYTNLFLLQNCSTYNELFIDSYSEYRIFSEIKRLCSIEKGAPYLNDLQERDDELFFNYNGQIINTCIVKENGATIKYVLINGIRVSTCDEFVKHPRKLFKKMKEIISSI